MSRALTPAAAQALLLWGPIVLGLTALYGPTLVDLFTGLWRTDQQAHGPIVLGVAAWLAWRNWPAMLAASQPPRPRSAGWPLVLIGLLLYVIGRSQDILIFEVGSALWVLTAVLLLLRGTAAVRAQWFALFFMLFMIPLPGAFVDALTLPMKTAVSYVAESLLYTAGYPMARTGVILQIGQYKLLVADACAGLHTLFTLEALGLLYLNLVRRDSLFRNLTLGLLIVPISFAANVVRVIVLTLVTYYFGDAAGQGFLHGFAGMVLFLSALLIIMGADAVVQLAERRLGRLQGAAA